LLSGLTWCVQPDNIRQIVREIDYDTLLQDVTADTPQAQAFLKTETAAQFVEMYVDDLFAQFDGAEAGTVLNMDTLRAMVETNMHELLPVFREVMKEEADGTVNPDDIAEEDLKAMLRKVMDEEMPALLEELPTAIDFGMEDPEVQGMMTSLRNGLLGRLGIALAIFLSLVLFLLRVYHLRGFVWLSVVYFISAGINLLSGTSVELSLTMFPEDAVSFAAPLVALLGEKMTQSGIIYGVVAIVCVVAAVLCHNYLQKRSMPAYENIGPEY
jgi:hypothetical protein